jgi:hypothetical protein
MHHTYHPNTSTSSIQISSTHKTNPLSITPPQILTMKLQSILMTGLVFGATSAAQQVLNAFGEVSYGVDVSFPVHHLTFAQDQPIGNRRKLYEEFLNGCRAYYPDAPESCDLTEEDRVKMSIRQPASMQVRWMVMEGIACSVEYF